MDKKDIKIDKRSNSAKLTQTLLPSPNYNLDPLLLPISNDGPAKIRLKLLNEDLVFRFPISNGKVSQIFITWIKLLSKELPVLVIWPSRRYQNVLRNCFQKLEQQLIAQKYLWIQQVR